MIKIMIKVFPEFLRLLFFVFVSPFYNLLLSLRYGCIIHPFAHVSPGVKFGRGCIVGHAQLRTYHGGQIDIGNHTTIYGNCELFAHRDRKILVGDYCLLAKRTIIMTRNHAFNDPTQKIVDQGTIDADVTLGNDVWTGLDTKILPGVTIGDGCVIGTSAVVTKDVPLMSVAVGIPAKVIKKRGE